MKYLNSYKIFESSNIDEIINNIDDILLDIKDIGCLVVTKFKKAHFPRSITISDGKNLREWNYQDHIESSIRYDESEEMTTSQVKCCKSHWTFEPPESDKILSEINESLSRIREYLKQIGWEQNEVDSVFLGILPGSDSEISRNFICVKYIKSKH